MSVNSKMTAIADAIREKTGGTAALTLDGMAAAIAAISTGVSNIEFGTVTLSSVPSVTIPHSLGVLPNFAFLYKQSDIAKYQIKVCGYQGIFDDGKITTTNDYDSFAIAKTSSTTTMITNINAVAESYVTLGVADTSQYVLDGTFTYVLGRV